MKPLLKWAGGKRHIAPTLEEHLPQDWGKGKYFEPFIGGAAFFLHLQPRVARLSDVNSRLVQFYKDVKLQPEVLNQEITQVAETFNSLTQEGKKEFYLAIRSNFNSGELSLKSSVNFFALNKLCFNGLYRENSSGGFNVPFGQKKQFPSFNLDDFLQVSHSLRNTELAKLDFEEAVTDAKPGDFVYFDPPYIPLDVTSSFTSYSAEGFGLQSQKRLAGLMGELKQRGVQAMLSNSMSELTSTIYGDFRQVEIKAPRMVSANGASRGLVSELLIMNY